MSNAHTQARFGIRRMIGRSPSEGHRVASPLELLFDLTFAAAFGVAGSELAHGIVSGHVAPAILAFGFAMFGIVWAWINFSWFASAFDTDDWLFRITTMVQMAGVIVLAIGLPEMFESMDENGTFDNRVMVAGYVVMRVAMIAQWLRASRDPKYRTAALTYVFFISLAQIGWIILAIIPFTIGQALIFGLVLWCVEMMGPLVAERKGEKHGGGSTPWHPHHIAERYSLLTIITLGETVLGTLAAARMITEHDGWSFDSIAVIAIGIMLTFALWWQYFMLPSAEVLSVHRGRGFVWGYGHVLIFASIAAVGAGLHVVGYVFDPEHPIDETVAVVALAIPVMAFSLSLFAIYQWLVRHYRTVLVPQILTFALPAIGVWLSFVGSPLWVCLAAVLAGPVIVVVQFELGAWRELAKQRAKFEPDSEQTAPQA